MCYGWSWPGNCPANPCAGCPRVFIHKWGGERFDCRDEHCGEGIISPDFGCVHFKRRQP